MKQIRERLRERRRTLTKSEVLVAEWLEPSLERLAYLTVNEVASQSGVSEATIVRFSRKLGFESFTDMQRAAQGDLQKHFSLGDLVKSSLEGGDGLLERSYRKDLEHLRQTYENLDEAVFRQAIEALSKAKRVVVTGLRASSGAAVFLSFSLSLLRPGVSLLRFDLNNLHEQLIDLEPGDVLLAISLGRPAMQTLQAVSEAKNRHGATIVAIAGSSVSELARLADYTLVASGEGTFKNYTSVMSLAGTIIDGLAEELASAASERLDLLDEINAGMVYRQQRSRNGFTE